MIDKILIDMELAAGKAGKFEDLYFDLNRAILQSAPSVESRNGLTKEVLNFKTIVTNPRYRCVGGFKRDVNIFFLLAEAMWIWAGRRDVAFLEIFNSRMADYSDNGTTFHAPYGFRMRRFGVNSDNEYGDSSKHEMQGMDQLLTALQMMHRNPQDRRVVVQIWNAELDLDINSKDIPCNDLVMFKVRDGKLFTTVQNRSNDLHWGLLTNVFQFSFITEMMAQILELQPGDQVHNSQSLHVYMTLPLTNDLISEEIRAEKMKLQNLKLYDHCQPLSYIPFNFKEDSVPGRLHELDFHINSIILGLLRIYNGEDIDNSYYSEALIHFSPELYVYWRILKAYVLYKRSKNKTTFWDELKSLYNYAAIANKLM
jgi:thymidylate synthase